MKTIVGDLLQLAEEGQFDIIVHGCNCFHLMGAGIAGQIAKQYPQAYQADLETVKGDVCKLGTYSGSYVKRERDETSIFRIFNMYTQYKPGKCPKEVLYPSIRSCFNELSATFDHRIRIGIPMIGCGIAGGEWYEVEQIIYQTTQKLDITVVQWG